MSPLKVSTPQTPGTHEAEVDFGSTPKGRLLYGSEWKDEEQKFYNDDAKGTTISTALLKFANQARRHQDRLERRAARTRGFWSPPQPGVYRAPNDASDSDASSDDTDNSKSSSFINLNSSRGSRKHYFTAVPAAILQSYKAIEAQANYDAFRSPQSKRLQHSLQEASLRAMRDLDKESELEAAVASTLSSLAIREKDAIKSAANALVQFASQNERKKLAAEEKLRQYLDSQEQERLRQNAILRAQQDAEEALQRQQEEERRRVEEEEEERRRQAIQQEEESRLAREQEEQAHNNPEPSHESNAEQNAKVGLNLEAAGSEEKDIASNKTAAAISAENEPVAITKPPRRVKLYIQEAEKRLKKLRDTEELLKQIQDSQDPSIKRGRLDLRKRVGEACNQISSKPSSIRLVVTKLTQLLTEARGLGDIFLQYAMYQIGQKLVNQSKFITETSACFPIAHVVTMACVHTPELSEIILGQFHQVCIYTIPRNATKKEGQSIQQWKEELGFLQESSKPDGLEEADAWSKRMSITVALLATIMQTQPWNSEPQPAGLSITDCWALLSRVLNRGPWPLTPQLIHAILETAGFELRRRYGRQFHKMMTLIEKDVIPRISQSSRAGAGPAISRLLQLITDYKRNGFALPEPEGMRLAESTVTEAEEEQEDGSKHNNNQDSNRYQQRGGYQSNSNRGRGGGTRGGYSRGGYSGRGGGRGGGRGAYVPR